MKFPRERVFGALGVLFGWFGSSPFCSKGFLFLRINRYLLTVVKSLR